ncbi:MAG TPA: O-antigen ligase family protein [Planctomycetota bacterium]|nr:O-antigen ligase family protein [Planctomycetota bacterium]
MLLWVMLWLNIEADPRHWRNPTGLVGYLHFARSLLAFAAAVGAYLFVRRRGTLGVFGRSGPVRLMAVYGLFMLGTSLLSASPFEALYWGALYLSVFIVLEAVVARSDPLSGSAQLLTLTWVMVATLAVGLAIVAWDVLFSSGDWWSSDVEVVNVIPAVGGVTMSRSTGIGRLAAVPAVFAFSRMWQARGPGRVLWGAVCGASIVLMLATRARTPLIGFVVAALFMLSVQRGKGALFLTMGVAGLAMLADATMAERIEGIVYRRGPGENLMRMTGRTEVWREGWEVFLRSPVLGLGPLADRFHMGLQHVHNTWLLALMQAGVAGTAFFVASWVVGWRLFFRSLRSLAALSAQHRTLLIEAGAVLAFFTVRSIPETTAAAFSVDLLVIVPILAYLEVLDRSLRQARARQSPPQPGSGRHCRLPVAGQPAALVGRSAWSRGGVG